MQEEDQLQVASGSAKLSNTTTDESKVQVQAEKKLVDEVKTQWKLLWSERFDDKERAEGVSTNDYQVLYIEQGTIIHATRDFKALSFKQILDQHMLENPERYIQPDINIGGWKKFIRTEVTNKNPKVRKRAAFYIPEKPKNQTPKKGGRGWLHKC